jgi:hypothetical protein
VLRKVSELTIGNTAVAKLTRNWLQTVGVGLLLVLCSLALSWVSSDFKNLTSWFSFFVLMLIGSGSLWLGWWLVRELAPPHWLGFLLVGAALLRLALGTVWYVVLPSGGYASPAERGGYVMADAYNRDRAAWQLSQSHKPLDRFLPAIRAYKKFDQYGGMLVISAVVYRIVGGQSHQPLMIVVLTASFSVLAILFTWAFARRAWGERVAKLAAWGLALYPEAILLGSSQMREAFLITLFTAAFYGLIRYLQVRSWKNIIWILAALLFSLPFSSPATALALVMLALLAFIGGDGRLLRQYKLWFIFGGLALVVLIGIWFAWSSYAPKGISNPFSLMAWWLKISAGLQERSTHNLSGWIQKIFGFTPAWTHMPLLLAYGIVRPFLPAALADTSSTPIWRLISLWRALGWMPVLLLLFYAPFMAFRKPQPGQEISYSVSRGLCLVIWLAVLTASLRAGADEWDNPRYRAMFAGLQIALAAWVWVRYRQTRDPWLKRTFVGLILVLSWFVLWYFERYTHLAWPVVDFFKTLGLGVSSAMLYLIWDLARTSFKIQD